jgi:hypothetical protein
MPALLSSSSVRDRRDKPSREAVLRRVSGEFYEMPCLRLTRGQAQRLFGLRSDVCQRVLATLLDDGTLECDSEQRYRLNDGATWPGRAGLARPGHVFRRTAS